MDEALEVVDLLADPGFESAFVWLFRLLGLVLVLAGLGLWLFTDAGLLLLPAVLLLGGLVLVAAPTVLLLLAEFA